MSLHDTLVDNGARVVGPTEYFSHSEAQTLVRLGATAYLIDEEHSDTAGFSVRYSVEAGRCLNSILVQTKSPQGLLESLILVPADARLKSSTLKAALHGKTSFVPSARAHELTGMAPGAITPLGLPNGIPVTIDTEALREASYIIGGKSRELKVEVPTSTIGTLATLDFTGLYE